MTENLRTSIPTTKPSRPGMVVTLDIFTFGPRQELIHSKDTYEILEDRSRLLSWYRNWDQLYVVEGIDPRMRRMGLNDLGIAERVQRALAASGFEAIIAVGADNVQYLSGARFPLLDGYPDRFAAVFWPRKGEPECICPVEWESTIRKLSWMKKIRSYAESENNTAPAVETLSRAVCVAVKAGSRVGLDMNRAPVTFGDSLRASLNEMKLENCDELLTELRMTKTLEEVRVLADVSYRTDHGILGAVHHIIITAPRTEMSLAERVRGHCLERGLEAVGYHSLSLMASGEHSRSSGLYHLSSASVEE